MIIILTIYFQIYEKERVLVSKRSISFTRNFVAAQEFAPEWPVRLQAQSEVLQQWGTRHPASASSLNFHQYKELKLEKDLEPKQTRRITKEKDQSSGIRIEEKDRLTPTHLKIVKDKNLSIAIAHLIALSKESDFEIYIYASFNEIRPFLLSSNTSLLAWKKINK